MPSNAIHPRKLGAPFSTCMLFWFIQIINDHEPAIVEIIWKFLSDMMKNLLHCKDCNKDLLCLKISKFSKRELRKLELVIIPVFWRERRERRELELVILPVPCTCKKCKTKKWLKLREEGREEKRNNCRICRNPASDDCDRGLCGKCCIHISCTEHQHSFQTRSWNRYKK